MPLQTHYRLEARPKTPFLGLATLADISAGVFYGLEVSPDRCATLFAP